MTPQHIPRLRQAKERRNARSRPFNPATQVGNQTQGLPQQPNAEAWKGIGDRYMQELAKTYSAAIGADVKKVHVSNPEKFGAVVNAVNLLKDEKIGQGLEEIDAGTAAFLDVFQEMGIEGFKGGIAPGLSLMLTEKQLKESQQERTVAENVKTAFTDPGGNFTPMSFARAVSGIAGRDPVINRGPLVDQTRASYDAAIDALGNPMTPIIPQTFVGDAGGLNKVLRQTIRDFSSPASIALTVQFPGATQMAAGVLSRLAAKKGADAVSGKALQLAAKFMDDGTYLNALKLEAKGELGANFLINALTDQGVEMNMAQQIAIGLIGGIGAITAPGLVTRGVKAGAKGAGLDAPFKGINLRDLDRGDLSPAGVAETRRVTTGAAIAKQQQALDAVDRDLDNRPRPDDEIPIDVDDNDAIGDAGIDEGVEDAEAGDSRARQAVQIETLARYESGQFDPLDPSDKKNIALLEGSAPLDYDPEVGVVTGRTRPGRSPHMDPREEIAEDQTLDRMFAFGNSAALRAPDGSLAAGPASAIVNSFEDLEVGLRASFPNVSREQNAHITGYMTFMRARAKFIAAARGITEEDWLRERIAGFNTDGIVFVDPDELRIARFDVDGPYTGFNIINRTQGVQGSTTARTVWAETEKGKIRHYLRAVITSHFGDTTQDLDVIEGLVAPSALKREMIDETEVLWHELGHVIRKDIYDLDPNARATLEAWSGVPVGTTTPGGRWDGDAEEKFARGFMTWISEGGLARNIESSTPIDRIFHSIAVWLRQIAFAEYSSVGGTAGREHMDPIVAQAFDSILSGKKLGKFEVDNYLRQFENEGRLNLDDDPNLDPGGYSIYDDTAAKRKARAKSRLEQEYRSIVQGGIGEGDYVGPEIATWLKIQDEINGLITTGQPYVTSPTGKVKRSRNYKKIQQLEAKQGRVKELIDELSVPLFDLRGRSQEFVSRPPDDYIDLPDRSGQDLSRFNNPSNRDRFLRKQRRNDEQAVERHNDEVDRRQQRVEDLATPGKKLPRATRKSKRAEVRQEQRASTEERRATRRAERDASPFSQITGQASRRVREAELAKAESIAEKDVPPALEEPYESFQQPFEINYGPAAGLDIEPIRPARALSADDAKHSQYNHISYVVRDRGRDVALIGFTRHAPNRKLKIGNGEWHMNVANQDSIPLSDAQISGVVDFIRVQHSTSARGRAMIQKVRNLPESRPRATQEFASRGPTDSPEDAAAAGRGAGDGGRDFDSEINLLKAREEAIDGELDRRLDQNYADVKSGKPESEPFAEGELEGLHRQIRELAKRGNDLFDEKLDAITPEDAAPAGRGPDAGDRNNERFRQLELDEQLEADVSTIRAFRRGETPAAPKERLDEEQVTDIAGRGTDEINPYARANEEIKLAEDKTSQALHAARLRQTERLGLESGDPVSVEIEKASLAGTAVPFETAYRLVREHITPRMLDIIRRAGRQTKADIAARAAIARKAAAVSAKIFLTSKATGEDLGKQATSPLKAVGEKPLSAYDRAPLRGLGSDPANALSEADIHLIFESINRNPRMRPYTKLNTMKAVWKLIDGEHVTRFDIQRLQTVFGKEVTAGLFDNRGFKRKAFDELMDILGIPRLLLATMDFSAPLRQALLPLGGHPIRWAKTWGPAWKGAISGKHYDQQRAAREAKPNHRIFTESSSPDLPESQRGLGLYETDPEGGVRGSEEAFLSQFLKRLPDRAGRIPVAGNQVKFILNGLGQVAGYPIRFSERGWSGFLDELRYGLMDDAWESWKHTNDSNGKPSWELDEATKEMVPSQQTLQDGRDLARYINISTGRGDLGMLEGAAAPLANIFFSPRLMVARMQAPYELVRWDRSKRVKNHIYRDFAGTIGGGSAVLGLAALAGASVETNPTSSDFGRIQVGNTRVDIWGGFQPLVRTLFRTFLLQRKSTGTGRTVHVDNPADVLEEFWNFFRAKMAPVVGFTTDVIAGGNFTGDEINFEGDNMGREMFARFAPLILQDLAEAWEADGLTGIALAAPSFFGTSVIAYQGIEEVSRRDYKYPEGHPNAGRPGRKGLANLTELDYSMFEDLPSFMQDNAIYMNKFEGSRKDSEFSAQIEKLDQDYWTTLVGIMDDPDKTDSVKVSGFFDAGNTRSDTRSGAFETAYGVFESSTDEPKDDNAKAMRMYYDLVRYASGAGNKEFLNEEFEAGLVELHGAWTPEQLQWVQANTNNRIIPKEMYNILPDKQRRRYHESNLAREALVEVWAKDADEVSAQMASRIPDITGTREQIEADDVVNADEYNEKRIRSGLPPLAEAPGAVGFDEFTTKESRAQKAGKKKLPPPLAIPTRVPEAFDEFTTADTRATATAAAGR